MDLKSENARLRNENMELSRQLHEALRMALVSGEQVQVLAERLQVLAERLQEADERIKELSERIRELEAQLAQLTFIQEQFQQEWAGQMIGFLLDIKAEVEQARQQGENPLLALSNLFAGQILAPSMSG